MTGTRIRFYLFAGFPEISAVATVRAQRIEWSGLGCGQHQAGRWFTLCSE